MFSRILGWLFRGDSGAPPKQTKKAASETIDATEAAPTAKREESLVDSATRAPRKTAPKVVAPQSDTPGPRVARKERTETVEAHRDPLDLDIGLDIGTSCSKAVVGNRELSEQVAVPLNGGRTLAGYLLPTRVHLTGGVYSLRETKDGQTRQNLKIRLLHRSESGNSFQGRTVGDLVAFVALTLRCVLEWHGEKFSGLHRQRLVSWNLNIGLPSKGSGDDPFEAIYGRIVKAAVSLVPGNGPITEQAVETAMAIPGEPDWLPFARIHYYPEAAAQLASLIFSPHRPEGCLLVVDVGAGTLDISTLRISGSATGARCVFHCCEVAPLGVHFLHLARSGYVYERRDAAEFDRLIESIPADDGINAVSGIRMTDAPTRFREACKEVILKNVVRYRKHLKGVHLSRTFKPWPAGLPYVLSGGGRRVEYFQQLLSADLRHWLDTVCSEWDQTLIGGPKRGLTLRPFPTPKAFEPRFLSVDFDRFSVAHGLSLGVDNLMQVTQARVD